MRYLVLLAFLILGCSASTRAGSLHSSRWFKADFPEEYGALQTTPGGLRYYSPRDSIVEDEYDFMADTVESCLLEAFPGGKVNESGCSGPLRINRDVVIIVGPWHLNCLGTEQVLDVSAPQLGCDAKGIPTVCEAHRDRDGCHWRSGVTEGLSWYQTHRGRTLPIINVPPRGFMLPDALASLWANCSNIWASKAKVCARPLVKPL